MPANAPTVVLVGRRLPHNENLGLAYLSAALRRAGFEVAVQYVNGAADLARAASFVLTTRPAVLGLSLADGGSAFLPLALGELLRRAGYAGHVTCGGQFATLARDWLLSRYPWLDSVVRFAGEVPIVGIARRAVRGEPVMGIPGVTTRGGDGPPAPILDPAPMALRPERDDLPEILGHRAAHVAASRGCLARCQYCGPAALHVLERSEGKRAGVDTPTLLEHGVGGVRRRDLSAVCDEMAHLWRERGVRYFYFVDEHILPYDEAGALAFLDDWRRELSRRAVGPLGIGAMLRADRLTPAVARRFVDVGLVRAFIGLEIATPEEGRRFARPAPTERELGVLRDLSAAGVATVSNLMLVHPYSTPESIAAGIELLARIPGGVFEATRMQVYHGTLLHRRMAAEGRLVGNPLRYGYVFPDPAMERFAEVFSRLRGEAFWNYSVAYRTHDAHLALELARRLLPERVDARVTARIEEARRAVTALYVEAYRGALALALAGGGFQEASPLVAETRERAGGLERALESLERDLLAWSPRPARPFAPMRSAAAGVVSFVLLAGCGGQVATSPEPGADAGAGAGGTGGAGGGTTSSTTTTSGSTGGGTTTGTDAGVDAEACTPEQVEGALQQASALVEQKVPCFSGAVVLSAGSPPQPDFYVNAYGGYLSLRDCQTAPSEQAAKALEGAVAQALAGNVPACAWGAPPGLSFGVQGDATKEAEAMGKAIEAACGAQLEYAQFQIVLDAKGAVVDVKADPAFQIVAQCIESALAGLSFPCLASFEVCPEYVIAE